MAESDEDFVAIGKTELATLYQYGFRNDFDLLDMGCGYGRLAYALAQNGEYIGRYFGIDILPLHLRWCRDTIAAQFPRFRFECLDVSNSRYNPDGRVDAREAVFPIVSSEYDYCCLLSVFTHMYEAEIRNYLKEIHRILKPGAVCLATCFIYDAERLTAVLDTKCHYPMVYQLNDYTRYFNPQDPLNAIAYERTRIEDMIMQEKFQSIELHYGTWAAGGSSSFQDVAVFRKPA